MKTVNINQANLEAFVNEAQRGGVIIMRDGPPTAVVLGVEGLDQEQLELGLSDRFWKLITERRKERSLSRAELERRLNDRSATESS